MVVKELGEPSNLTLVEGPDPEPRPGEVILAVRSIGCNFFDILIVQGRYQIQPELPFSPGAEVAGEVQAVGPGVTRVKPGDRVMGLLAYGGYTDRIAIEEKRVFRIPESMSFDEAAALGVVYQTSYFALVDRADLRPRQTLLVHAAAGGVGLAAVQIGRALGAHVIGTASSADKLALVCEHGAHEALDYRDEQWVARVNEITGGRGANVIYDPVGGDVFDRSLRCIAFGGRLLVIGFASGRIPEVKMNRILLKNIALVGLHWGEYFTHDPQRVAAVMDALFTLYQRGAVRPLVSATRPLREAAEALADLARRKTVGKLVLHP
jgi:NADPH2:quinone reductase